MQHATLTHPPFHPLTPTRLRPSLVWAPLLLLGALGGGAYWYLTGRATPPPAQATSTETTAWPSWLKQSAAYTPEPPAAPPPAAPVRDIGAERDAEILRQLQALRAEMDAKKVKPVTTPQEPKTPAAPKAKYAPMLFVARELKDKAVPESAAPTYLLAPGDTKIPCTVETAMSSEVPSIFTAKVRINVYDSKTRTKVLIPQNSTILGEYKSSELLYGNTRIPTVALTVALPDGSSVDLGNAPITDQRGIAGLSGEVNTHFWRNLSAVLITGVLRSGAQVAQVTAPAAAGVVQSTNQYGQQLAGRAIDTRPTITVGAGELCTVILVRELRLPAYQL